MANICENRFLFVCETKADEWLDKLSNLLEPFEGEFEVNDSFEDGCSVEGWFTSKWTFPIHIFEEFIPDDTDVYFRCLSEEYGCNYVAMNIYENGNWKEEQTFDL